MAISEFHIENQSVHDVKALLAEPRGRAGEDLELRWVDLLIRQDVLREVELGEVDRRFLYESALVIRLYLLPLHAGGVFAIAPVRHEVGIMPPGSSEDVYSVGCIDLDEPRDGRKIFDVRRRDSALRTKDYPELLRRAGIQQESRSFKPRWHGQSCAASEFRSPYRDSAARSARDWKPDPHGEDFRRLFEEPSCKALHDASVCGDASPPTPKGKPCAQSQATPNGSGRASSTSPAPTRTR